jgi:hypothetical protein
MSQHEVTAEESSRTNQMEADVGAQPSALRSALAGLIGNVLEWFDFAVYGYFAGDIGRQFFPQSSATAQQLLAFAVFALRCGSIRLLTRGSIPSRSLNDHATFHARNSKMSRKVQQIKRAD